MHRLLVIVILLLSLLAITITRVAPRPVPTTPQAHAIRISQVYGGGGNTGATYTHDFIELFNSGPSPVNLTGWTVQYASASGSTWQSTALSGAIAPGQYYLVREAQGAGGTVPLPTPDATGSIAMSASQGKVALVTTSTPLSGTCPTDSSLVDLVGYGGANCFEGSGPAPGLSNTTAALRAGNGCIDTDRNDADFSTGAPNPRHSGSPAQPCGDAAPFVSSTLPASGATGIATDANVTLNFSEPVKTTGNWTQLHCTLSGDHPATVSGGPQTFTLTPATPFQTGDTCIVSVYAAQVTDQDSSDPPDNMAADYSFKFFVVGACTTIPTIQGADNASLCGSVSNIQGCITGVAANGFYMQDVTGDGNPATSDGIYVYKGSSWTNPDNLAPGDLVSVSGTIIEFYNTTEFQYNNIVTRLGACPIPAPVTINPNTDPSADPTVLYERFEGMRVQMTFNGWVVGPTRRYVSRFAYGDPEIAFVDFGSRIPAYSRVFADDYPGYRGLNYLSGGLNRDLPNLDFGDEIAGTAVTGVLGYQFDKYTLLVDSDPALTTVDRPDVLSDETPANPAAGEFDICFANVKNLFDPHDDGLGDWGDWAPGWPTPDTSEGQVAYRSKLDKVANVLVNKTRSCMVIGLAEMEGKQSVYDDLAAVMHDLDATHTWTAAFVPSGDARNITQGFLYREDVTLVGSVTPVSGAPYTGWVSDGTLDFRRTPATGLFRFNAGTPDPIDIYIYAVHFKSKRSDPACATPDCTDWREKEAADLRDILVHHQGAGEKAIGGGDFNDTFGSTPIGLLDAVSPLIGNLYYDLPTQARWSYIFSGESQVLDHLYVTGNLLPANSGWAHTFNPVHANADFPEPENASDHDPIRVRFARCTTPAAPANLAITRSQGTDVALAWSAVPNVTTYQVWRDTRPYFTPGGTPLVTVSTPAHTDPGVLGNPAQNFYYLITSTNACDQTSGPSNRVGKYDFALVPGQP